MEIRKTTGEELLRYGKFFVDNTYATPFGIYRIHIVLYHENLFFVKMKNGEFTEVTNLSKKQKQLRDPKKFIDETILNILTELRINPKYKGYAYIVFAIKKALDEPECLYFSKYQGYKIYEYIQKEFNVEKRNTMRVAIQIAINNSLNGANYSTICKYFGDTEKVANGNMTPIEFIAAITNYIKVEVLR